MLSGDLLSLNPRVPGVQNSIGTYYSTIFGDWALENCTEVNTKSEQGKSERRVAKISNDLVPRAAMRLQSLLRM
jgi:hypothetical protein